MRLHGILTIVALLLIAGGALPMLMGETMSLTGEHDGAMFGELLFTVGTDPYYVGDFKHTNIHESSLQLYGVMGGVEIPVTLDDIDYENGRYALNYLLSLDTNQVLNLDGTYDSVNGWFVDKSGNGNHGTPYNGATTGTGVVGDGMTGFDATSYIGISGNDGIRLGNEGTVSLWGNAISLPNVLNILFSSTGSEDADKAPYFFVRNSDRLLIAIIGNGVTSRYIVSDLVFTTGTYHHCVLTWDGTNVNMYLDNANYNTAQANTNQWTGDFSVGWYNLSRFFNGTLDEIRIYDRALTPDEVSYLNDCVDVSNIEYPYGTEIYASYTYSDTFAPIGSDLFGLGVSLVGCVMLIVVVVGSTGRW